MVRQVNTSENIGATSITSFVVPDSDEEAQKLQTYILTFDKSKAQQNENNYGKMNTYFNYFKRRTDNQFNQIIKIPFNTEMFCYLFVEDFVLS